LQQESLGVGLGAMVVEPIAHSPKRCQLARNGSDVRLL
jgi:hypothetical protein